MRYCKSYSSALKKGRDKYKTGKPCSRGHIAPRYTSTRRCIECDRLNTHNRRISVKTQTPPWADHDKIKSVYEQSKLLGPDYSVDHDIPLRGELISGLHVHTNLVIIDMKENLSKQNRYEHG